MAIRAIRADTELYERLLLFEPVDIGELRQRLVAASPDLQALGDHRLRHFLDSQGFLFSSSSSAARRMTRAGMPLSGRWSQPATCTTTCACIGASRSSRGSTTHARLLLGLSC
mmetsp:Transcript_71157/g.206410  ORF Transcript_71157/g.206410 Transcript_71157/m.206410 type:complete len:113 (-) Transcript_71157:39-377(-)